MIVYIETNFVLELVFLQNEHLDCTRLLEMATSREIELVVPAYALVEPYEKLIRRSRGRKELSVQLRNELVELGRSASHSEDAQRYADLTGLLITSSEKENERLAKAQGSLLTIATIIPIDNVVLCNALASQRELGLGPQDSIVYSAVRQHMHSQSKDRCFINKNTRDFSEPRIQAEFKALGCPVIPKFSDGRAYAEAALARQANAPPSPAPPHNGSAD